MRWSYSTSASISNTSPPRVSGSATVWTVSTLPSSQLRIQRDLHAERKREPIELGRDLIGFEA